MDADYPKGMTQEIEQFFLSEESRPAGLDSYDDVFSSHYFFPLQRRRELEKMMQIARSIAPKTVMEIGCDKSGGLYHWCKCLPSVQHVIACEIRGTPYANAFEKAFPKIEFLWLPQSSMGDAIGSVDNWLAMRGSRVRIDCLFIDGDKSAFLKDFNAYLPMMNPQGIVFMHDVQDRPPMAAFETVKRRGLHDCSVILDVSESEEAVERERSGIPSTCEHENWLRIWKGRSCGVGVIKLEGNQA